MTFHLNIKIKKGSHRRPSGGGSAMEIAVLAAGFKLKVLDTFSRSDH